METPLKIFIHDISDVIADDMEQVAEVLGVGTHDLEVDIEITEELQLVVRVYREYVENAV